MKKLTINGQEIEITIHQRSGEEVSFSLNGTTYNYRQRAGVRPFEMALESEKGNHLFHWNQTEGVIDGWDVTVREALPTKAKRTSLGGDDDNIRSPMPGKILQIHVKAGDAVEEGQALAVMEAMKMEHTIKAPRAGIVGDAPLSPGDRVAGGSILVKLEKMT